MFVSQYRSIGLNILKCRRLRGYTQEVLADKAGISRSKLSDIERGKGGYSIELIFMLAVALDIAYEKLLTGD